MPGLVLVGTEVKSLRAGRINFQDSFCRIENNECWLYNMHIMPYELGNRYNVEPLRKRKLLLHAWEIAELRAQTEQKGSDHCAALHSISSVVLPNWRSL